MKNRILSSIQKEVLVGVLLGDGHLEKRGNSYRIKFQQSNFHKDYIMHLYEIFKNLTKSEPKSKIIKSFGKEQISWYFNTISHLDFKYYGELFYKEKKKIIPNNLDSLLTPRGLAYWFMDDGGLKSHQSKGVIIHTDNFTLSEIESICGLFEKKWGLSSWPRKQIDGSQIYISGKSYEKLRELIYPFLIEDMYYKFPSERNR